MDVEEMVRRYEEAKKKGTLRSKGSGVSGEIRKVVKDLITKSGKKYMKLRDIVAYFRENNYHKKWGIDKQQIYSKVRMALQAKTSGLVFGLDEDNDIVVVLKQ